MDRMNESEREARLRAAQAMLDDAYKRDATSSAGDRPALSRGDVQRAELAKVAPADAKKRVQLSRAEEVQRARQASADARYKRNAVQRPEPEPPARAPQQSLADLQDRFAAGNISPEAYRRAVESLQRGQGRDSAVIDLADQRDSGLIDDAEYQRLVEAMGY